MKTIAKQLKIKNFPFEIKDSNGNIIYFENSNGYWCKREYDSIGNEVYFENSDGFWNKAIYNSSGKQIYYETSKGVIVDNRSVVLTMNEIAKKFNIDVKDLKIVI